MTKIKIIEANESYYIEIFNSLFSENEEYKIKFVEPGILGLFVNEAEVYRLKVSSKMMRDVIKGKDIFIVTDDINPEFVFIKKYSLAS